MTAAGVSKVSAQQALVQLMQGNLENLKTQLPYQALTGPLARGDALTIKRHTAALQVTDYASLYRILGLHTLAFAPDLSPDMTTMLREILEKE